MRTNKQNIEKQEEIAYLSRMMSLCCVMDDGQSDLQEHKT
jgi:hypothetical protein